MDITLVSISFRKQIAFNSAAALLLTTDSFFMLLSNLAERGFEELSKDWLIASAMVGRRGFPFRLEMIASEFLVPGLAGREIFKSINDGIIGLDRTEIGVDNEVELGAFSWDCKLIDVDDESGGKVSSDENNGGSMAAVSVLPNEDLQKWEE